jgi:hypothetical protein
LAADKNYRDDSAATAPDNRRRAFRLATRFVVRVSVAKGERGARDWPLDEDGDRRVLDTFSEDISVGGLRFRAPKVLGPGTPVEVVFDLDGHHIELAAKVAHAAADDFGAGIGVEFTNVERSSAGAQISRFLFARERRRLPRVQVMYAVQCHTASADRESSGATEECSPSFVRVLLEDAIEPGRPVTVTLAIEPPPIKLAGRVVACTRASQMWRTSVELDEPVPERWTNLVLDRRSGLR